MTLTASGNKVILADDATKLEVVVVKSTTSYIKEKLAERPICYGELSKFPICIHGCVTMGANPLGFFTRLLTPALLSIDMRPPQALKKIVAEITRRKEGVEKVIYELKVDRLPFLCYLLSKVTPYFAKLYFPESAKNENNGKHHLKIFFESLILICAF